MKWETKKKFGKPIFKYVVLPTMNSIENLRPIKNAHPTLINFQYALDIYSLERIEGINAICENWLTGETKCIYIGSIVNQVIVIPHTTQPENFKLFTDVLRD